jgi:hypothetical protein
VLLKPYFPSRTVGVLKLDLTQFKFEGLRLRVSKDQIITLPLLANIRLSLIADVLPTLNKDNMVQLFVRETVPT